MAILSPQAPVAADTLFSIGSISKTFVAAAVGRLAQRGTIGLDDPLSKYVPDFPNAANISLRQMLSHTSGIREPFDDQDMADAILANPAQPWTTAQVLSWVGRPYFPPGTGYHYSNANFILLGEVIEKATGQSLASLVRSEFLTPLGLSHTFLQTEETVPGAKAHGYMAPASRPRDNSAGTMIPFTAEATAFGPAGAFVSTPTDLARWASALYGGNVLDQATTSCHGRHLAHVALHREAGSGVWARPRGNHGRRPGGMGPPRLPRRVLLGHGVPARLAFRDRRAGERVLGEPDRRRVQAGEGCACPGNGGLVGPVLGRSPPLRQESKSPA